MKLGENVNKLTPMIISCINILKTSENDYHLENSNKLLQMTLDELKMYKKRLEKKKEE